MYNSGKSARRNSFPGRSKSPVPAQRPRSSSLGAAPPSKTKRTEPETPIAAGQIDGLNSMHSVVSGEPSNTAAASIPDELLEEIRTTHAELRAIRVANNRGYLDALTLERRYDLLRDLLRGGDSTRTKRREAMIKIYKATPLDPSFSGVDKMIRDTVLAELYQYDELKDASRNWGELPAKEKFKLLGEVLLIQGKHMNKMTGTPVQAPGIKLVDSRSDFRAKLVIDTQGIATIELDKKMFKWSFDETFDAVIHENTHNYQHRLIVRLRNFSLPEGDPLYNQTLLFMANQGAGYINSGDGYREQPTERHAWLAGGEAGRLFRQEPVTKALLLLGLMRKWLKDHPEDSAEVDKVTEYCDVIQQKMLSGTMPGNIIFEWVSDYHQKFAAARLVLGIKAWMDENPGHGPLFKGLINQVEKEVQSKEELKNNMVLLSDRFENFKARAELE